MRKLIQHYVEMVIAMFGGMMIAGRLSAILLGGGAGAAHTTIVAQVIHITAMIISMVIPMVLWMRFRGTAWRHGGEMSVAMVAPAILIYAIALTWLGTFGSMTSIWSHGAMLLGMAALMFVQHDIYAGYDYALAAATGSIDGQRQALR